MLFKKVKCDLNHMKKKKVMSKDILSGTFLYIPNTDNFCKIILNMNKLRCYFVLENTLVLDIKYPYNEDNFNQLVKKYHKLLAKYNDKEDISMDIEYEVLKNNLNG